MIVGTVVVVISLILAFGHIWWGRQVTLKDLDALGNPVRILASYHACWYHISIIFLVLSSSSRSSSSSFASRRSCPVVSPVLLFLFLLLLVCFRL